MIKTFYQEHKRECRLLLLYLCLTPILALLNRPIGKVHNLSIPLDEKIPFIVNFMPIYSSWFPFLMYFSLRLIKKDSKAFLPLGYTLVLGSIFAYITYYFFQSTVTWPQAIPGGGFSHELLRLTHWADEPYACFPSLHVLTTWGLILATLHSTESKKIKTFVTLWGIVIMASTLFVKQHVFVDIPAGIIYASVIYCFFKGYDRKKENFIRKCMKKEE